MAIVIDIKVKVGQTLPQLKRIQTALDSINNTVGRINAGLVQMGTLAGAAASALGSANVARGAGGGNRGGGGGRSSSRSPRPPIVNPLAGMQAYAGAAASGDPNATRLFNRFSSAFTSQERGQARAAQFLTDPTGRGAKLQNVFNRTRFGNIGGKLTAMPLGIDLQAIAGGIGAGVGNVAGTVAGIAGTAVGGPILGEVAEKSVKATFAALTAVAVGFAGTLAAATLQLRRFGAALAAGGGGAQAASTLGQGLGLNIAGIGQNLTPIGSAALGVSPFTGAFGALDYNIRGLRAIDSIRQARSFEEARRRSALLTGSTEASSAYLLDPYTYGTARNQTTSRGNDTQAIGAAASFAQAVVNLKNALVTAVGPVVIPVMKALARGFNDISNVLAQGGLPATIQAIGPALAVVVKNFTDSVSLILLINQMVDQLFNKILNIVTFGALGGDSQKAIKDNTDATNRNTNAINNMINPNSGTYGGGANSAGAIPGKLSPATNPAFGGAGYGVL